jgi:hypothetical protein
LTNWIPGQARNDEAFLRLRPFLRFAERGQEARPTGVGANNHSPCNLSGANAPHFDFSRIPPGDGKSDARRKPQHVVIAGSTRNPVRQSNFALRCTGENATGFRVEPAMTRRFFDNGLSFASPGVGLGLRKNMAALRAGGTTVGLRPLALSNLRGLSSRRRAGLQKNEGE